MGGRDWESVVGRLVRLGYQSSWIFEEVGREGELEREKYLGRSRQLPRNVPAQPIQQSIQAAFARRSGGCRNERDECQARYRS